MTSSDAAPLAQDLRAIFRALRRRLREQAPVGELTPSQSAVLMRLDRDGAATASALARAEGMRPQSIGPIIAALDKAGLATSAPDPDDRRQMLISITPAHAELLRIRREARQDWLESTINTRLSPQEQEALGKAMALLWRIVE